MVRIWNYFEPIFGFFSHFFFLAVCPCNTVFLTSLASFSILKIILKLLAAFLETKQTCFWSRLFFFLQKIVCSIVLLSFLLLDPLFFCGVKPSFFLCKRFRTYLSQYIWWLAVIFDMCFILNFWIIWFLFTWAEVSQLKIEYIEKILSKMLPF